MFDINQKSISIALQTNKPISEYLKLGKLIEQLGFDSISVYNDLFFQPPWIPLSELAYGTKKIQIGVSSVNPFTSHPINIAGNIANIDSLCNGRAFLGLSRGAWLDYLNILPRHPIQALRDAFVCIDHLLNKKNEKLESNFFPLKGNESFRWDLDRSDIPMILGSWGKRTIKVCKDYISEVKLGGTANHNLVPWLKDILKASDIGISLGCVTVIDDDGDKARKLARKEVALYLPVIGKLDSTLSIPDDVFSTITEATSRGKYIEAGSYIDDKLLSKFSFVGTPEEIISQSLSIFRAGASRIEYGTPHGSNELKGIELLGKKVLPELKSILKDGKNE